MKAIGLSARIPDGINTGEKAFEVMLIFEL
jgi:hypothetical protein